MRSAKGFLVGSALFAAAAYVLIRALGGEPLSRALIEGAIFAIVFVPVFWLGMMAVDRSYQRRRGMSVGWAVSVPNGPIQVADICTVNRPATEVATAVEQRMQALGGRLKRVAGPNSSVQLSAAFGSRLALRLLGIYLSAGRRRMPMKLEVDLRDDGPQRAVANISASSNEGWYLVRPASFEAEYQRALDSLVSQICGAARSDSSSSA